VQAAEGGADFLLGEDLRYAHDARAIARWAEEAGLAVAILEQASTRTDAGRPVPGLVVVLEKVETTR
jgi:predicted TPR repeat methyltransferase